MRSRAAALALLIALAISGVVQADTGTGQPYRWVNPPPALASTNQYPLGLIHTHSLFARGLYQLIGTHDAQVGLQWNRGAFGFPPKQTQLLFTILPLRHYVPVPGGDRILDGNVYHLGIRYLPSRRGITQTSTPIQISMNYPITLLGPQHPLQMIGLVDGHWRVLCDKQTLLISGVALCPTRIVPSQVALAYYALGSKAPAGKKKSSGISPLLFIAGAVLLGWLVAIFFLVRRKPVRGPGRDKGRPQGRATQRTRPPDAGREEQRHE